MSLCSSVYPVLDRGPSFTISFWWWRKRATRPPNRPEEARTALPSKGPFLPGGLLGLFFASSPHKCRGNRGGQLLSPADNFPPTSLISIVSAEPSR
ncbi:hypothetical protein SKAU_G00357140 [Synaphobranchus kaupii]|uniref:Uncharacterized protein n=1 Tax=Synaphobranchus kaupii TaxID=118154 RepID=A0A9Q1EHK2_SYNKA|nr:hypothetical protein SKAU_G00357140 [Synaphobranchus kaupii]